ncbi:uncharacterized protein LOC135372408 [Ornithodoros turicata]|uniref:uncharacterized protein LOC135372408 n=1 Tax=Ornithodoros turicata TaxID=34597 RepID=UPI00313A3D4A
MAFDRSSVRLAAAIVEFLSSSSSDSEDELAVVLRGTRAKVTDFVESVVRNFSDTEFRKHFRVTRTVCYKVVADYEKSPYFQQGSGRGPFAPKTAEEHVLSFLWFAGNKSSERAVALVFGMAESTIHDIIERVACFFESISKEVIRFPVTGEEKAACSEKFEKISGFPHVLGCVDGTYIETRCPVHKIASTYTNRHDKKSYGLQAICDSDCKFLDVFLGHTGKTHDAEAFRRSFIVDELARICADKYHILGDAAYALREYILTPYRDYGNLTPQQLNFNLCLSQTRVRIEHAFGLLKNRFRQLLLLEMWTVPKATQFILACCVLHNLCVDGGDVTIEDETVEGCCNVPMPGVTETCTTDVSRRDRLLRKLGEEKRKRISEYLYAFHHL